MDHILNQFGWTILNAHIYILSVLMNVRPVHHLNIITVITVKMSLWSVASSLINKCVIMIVFFTEFSYHYTRGPRATLDTCRNADSSNLLSNIYN